MKNINMRHHLKILLLTLLAMTLVSCAPSASPAPLPPQPLPATVVAATPAPAVTATAQPKDMPTRSSVESIGPDITAVTGDQLTVTLADNNKTITLQTGDHFLLNLGEIYQWKVDISDRTVVSPVEYIMAPHGNQGLFTARKAGQAVLTAQGDPACRSAKPACMLPSLIFKVTLVVK